MEAITVRHDVESVYCQSKDLFAMSVKDKETIICRERGFHVLVYNLCETLEIKL